MHFPSLPLLPGAAGGLCRFESILVYRFQRQIKYDILYLACLDIFLVDQRCRLTDVPGAERSLVICELDHCQFSRVLTPGRVASEVQKNFLEWLCRRCLSPALQQGLDIL